MSIRAYPACLLLVLACGDATPDRPAAAPPRPTPPVEPSIDVRLVTDADEVAPGAGFRVGALFTVDDGWHIYWDNPGDAGLRTRLELSAPDGFTVGPVQYPGPVRFTSPGDIVSFGYDEDAALIVDLVAPPGADPDGAATLEARVSWLACKDLCISGRESLTLVVPVEREIAAAGKEILDEHAAHLPRQLSELAGATSEWRSEGDRTILALTIPEVAALRFFPDRNDAVVYAGQEVAADAGATRIEIAFEVDRTHPDLLPGRQGVLRVQRSDGAVYHHIALPWPSGGSS